MAIRGGNKGLAGALLAVGGLVSCSGGAAPGVSPVPVTEQMYVHFQDALDMRAGAVFGDLDRVQRAGVRIAGTESAERLPPSSERFMRRLRAAANSAAAAEDDRAARTAAADVARACGACHRPYRVGPEFSVGGPPPGESLATHMARQDRISRLLWDGLIGPSNETWQAGAEALAEEGPFPPEIRSRVQDSEYLETAQTELQTLGRHALANTDPMARSQTLSRVWGVCAGCHTVAGIFGDT